MTKVGESATKRPAPAASAAKRLGHADRAAPLLAYLALYLVLLLTLLWGRTLQAVVLLAATALALAAFAIIGQTVRRSARPILYGALAALVLGIAAGAVTERRLERVTGDWGAIVAERQARLGTDLQSRLGAEIAAAVDAAESAATALRLERESARFVTLNQIRTRSGVAALALFDAAGELLAWTGNHHGMLPLEVRSGPAGSAIFRERPLVSYLYVSAPAGERGERAVAAVRLDSGAPAGATGDFAERFAQRTGMRPHFGAGDHGSAVWRLHEDGEVIAHARLEALSQSEWHARIATAGLRASFGFAVAALLLLAIGWTRTRRRMRVRAPAWTAAAPLAATAPALAIAPLGSVLGLERLFSPALFVLPVPGDIVLGTLLAVLLPLGAVAAAFTPGLLRGGRLELRLLVGAAAIALGFPALIALLLLGGTPRLLEGGVYLWVGVLPAATLLLTGLAALVLPQPRPRPLRVLPLALAAGLCVLLALAPPARWQPDQNPQLWFAALWAVPFVLFGLGLASYTGRAGRVARWLAMGWLASTALVPQLWMAQLQATLHAAERELESLGVRTDPFVDYLLQQYARDVVARRAAGEDGVQLLFRSWGESGLAREAGAARVTLWDWTLHGIIAEADLVLGEMAQLRQDRNPSPALALAMERARSTQQPVVETSAGGEHLLAVPLDAERVVSVILPPRRTLERSTALLPFPDAEPRPEAKLTLLPAALAHPIPEAGVGWRRTDSGWRSEAIIRYPDGDYHAHLDLRVPAPGVRFARGVLLVAAMLGMLGLLWVVGRLARGDPPAPQEGWGAWIGSFRARVTLALFIFFLAPTIVFGAVAYRALAGEGERAARATAERAVNQAVAVFPDERGDLRALASHTGHEVLYYYRGELAGASSADALQLGVFNAWMPPATYATLHGGEELSAVADLRIADRPHAMAYRRLQAAGTLAVPVPLTAGDSALRQAELAHLILFAVLMGGLLSLALSLAVGRALTGPIGQLRRAAAAVGAGRLQVRLPEERADEFGLVFASFNRMVRRLRRARSQELRTARVLAWGEMARQIAHGIKNPLTPIKLSVQHLRRAYADGRPEFGEILESNVDEVLREIDRLGDLARAFSRYGAPGSAGALEDVDVGGVIREALTLYRAGDRTVTYRESVPTDLPAARARTAELKEVLLNLLENARSALDGSGTIRVGAVRARGGVELVVEDDGQGIPEDLLPRVFEPHFSTRSYGTGLGLAIVRRLVESWGGTVVAESGAGRGTRVQVWIPAAARITGDGSDS